VFPGKVLLEVGASGRCYFVVNAGKTASSRSLGVWTVLTMEYSWNMQLCTVTRLLIPGLLIITHDKRNKKTNRLCCSYRDTVRVRLRVSTSVSIPGPVFSFPGISHSRDSRALGNDVYCRTTSAVLL